MFSSALKSFQSNISSNYTLSPQPSSSAGPWKIFDAKHRKHGKAVSVFVFDKKSLDPQTGGLGSRSSESNIRRAREEIIERLKKEASALARLRHPSILELAEPVEDTRSGGLMFAAEPVTASLAGLLQEKDEQERHGGVSGRGSRYVIEESDGTKRRRELEIDELEIQKGLLQIGKGLEFMHWSATLVHGNLTPEAIFINAKGDWKISGLGFAGPPDGTNSQTNSTPIALSEVLNYDARLPRSVQLNLDYSSPDFVMDLNVTVAADMFSLGLLIVALYNSPHRSPIETNGSVSTYKKIFSSASTVPSQSNNFISSQPLPKELVSSVLPRLITRRPAQRLSAREFQQAQYFDNILVSTIRFLDSLPAKTPNEKMQFMRGLPRILSQFPKSVLEKKVLPALLEEMKDRELLSLVLQNAFKIVKNLPSGKRAFTEKVIPRLREIFLAPTNSKTAPAEQRDSLKEAGLMVVLENMDIIGESSSGKEFKDDVMPIIILALESSTHTVTDAALRTLPTCLEVLDFSTVKNEIFPIIANVFAKTSSMGIKIRGLQALNFLCGGNTDAEDDGDGLDGFAGTGKEKKKTSSVVLDKYTIQEKVVPLLKGVKTKEPAVMMAALAVFNAIGKVVDSDFLAIEILPILWNFALGPLLNLQQFQSFLTLIKSLSSRIEVEQTRKLQELSTNNNTATVTSSSDFLSFGSKHKSNGTDFSTNGNDADFESLVTGRKAQGSSSTDTFDDPWAAATPSISNSRPSMSSRAASQPKTSPPPTFSWSSQPSLNPNTSTMGGFAALQPTPASRAITPDLTLSSFAALQPAAPSMAQSSFSLPLQPSQPSMSTFSPVSPGNGTTGGSSQSSVNWSNTLASTSAWQSSNSSSGGFQSAASTLPASIPFTISPPPQPATSPYSSFSIAPPPAQLQSRQSSFGGGGSMSNGGLGGVNMRVGMANGMGAEAQQTKVEKGGIDKYESLL